MDLQKNLYKYANLVINKALQIKKDDFLLINGQVENKDFICILAEEAFKAGAKDVKIKYSDENFTKLRYKYASKETLSNVENYIVDEYDSYIEKGAKVLSLVGGNPNILSEIDSDKIIASGTARSKALKNFNANLMKNSNSWCVIGAAVKSWAKVVFPDLDENEALNKLWELILYTCRIDNNDPIENWDKHIVNLKKNSEFLNREQFDYFVIKNDRGTDLKIGMPENYIFTGASEDNLRSEEFIANMPTEEVFSAPHKDRVDGIVYNTKALNLNGVIVDDFFLKFKDGKVVDYDAKVGYEALDNLLKSYENADRLGEIAFVPYDSPISNTNILFYNTLFDENASCHIALGKAYPSSIKNGENMSDEELSKNGINDSLTHVDFMIGDGSTEIIGVKKDSSKIQIFKDGNFVI